MLLSGFEFCNYLRLNNLMGKSYFVTFSDPYPRALVSSPQLCCSVNYMAGAWNMLCLHSSLESEGLAEWHTQMQFNAAC